MIVDIEKYLLTPWERNRVDWFPTWFTYNVTEAESAEWEKMIELKEKEWPFNESKDSKDSKDDKTKNKIETLEQSLDEIKLILEQLRVEAREKNENHS